MSPALPPVAPMLTPEILKVAQKVTSDGLLKFSDVIDKTALMSLTKTFAEQADAVRPTRYGEFNFVWEWVVAGLKECDRAVGWRTVRLTPGETDAERQLREDRIYGMLASLYLLGRDGVKVGYLEGR